MHGQGQRPGPVRGVVRACSLRTSTVLAPIRDERIPREKAIALAAEWGIPVSERRDDRTRSTRTCGAGPPNAGRSRIRGSRRPRTRSRGRRPPADRPAEPSEISVGVRLAASRWRSTATGALADLIRALDALGGSYGFGRVDMIENRRVGIKTPRALRGPGRARRSSRAHRALEDLTLEREVAHTSRRSRHGGPSSCTTGSGSHRCACARRLSWTRPRTHVSGEVRLRYEPGSCTVVGRRSEQSLYDLSLATYGAGDAFDQSVTRGYMRCRGCR